MSVTVTYPGIYIQELPGPTATITPAPTSVTVFIGYTHPFRTQSFGQAVQLFSFSDYQQEFGGLYSNAWLDANVAYAVQQFFLNGGSVAYVVGLQCSQANLPFFSGWTPPAFPVPTATPGASANLGTPQAAEPSGSLTFAAAAGATGATGITFWGLEPVDPGHPLTVTVSNPASSANNTTLDMADLTFTYGSVVETFRRVSLLQRVPVPSPAPTPSPPATPNPNFIETRVNGVSQLVWVSTLSRTPRRPTHTAQRSRQPPTATDRGHQPIHPARRCRGFRCKQTSSEYHQADPLSKTVRSTRFPYST